MTMVEIIIFRYRLTLWRQGLSYVLLSSMLFSEDQRVEGRLLSTWKLMIALLESETAARLWLGWIVFLAPFEVLLLLGITGSPRRLHFAVCRTFWFTRGVEDASFQLIHRDTWVKTWSSIIIVLGLAPGGGASHLGFGSSHRAFDFVLDSCLRQRPFRLSCERLLFRMIRRRFPLLWGREILLLHGGCFGFLGLVSTLRSRLSLLDRKLCRRCLLRLSGTVLSLSWRSSITQPFHCILALGHILFLSCLLWWKSLCSLRLQRGSCALTQDYRSLGRLSHLRHLLGPLGCGQANHFLIDWWLLWEGGNLGPSQVYRTIGHLCLTGRVHDHGARWQGNLGVPLSLTLFICHQNSPLMGSFGCILTFRCL